MNFEFQLFEYENSVFAFYQEFFVIVILFYMQINERINIYKNGRCNVVLHLCIDKKFPPFNSENYLIFKTKCKHFIGIVMSFHTNCEYCCLISIAKFSFKNWNISYVHCRCCQLNFK